MYSVKAYKLKSLGQVLKEYKALRWLIVITFVSGLLFLIMRENSASMPDKDVWIMTVFLWFIGVLIFSLIVYSEEYHHQLILLKRLKSEKYAFLHKHGFKIVEPLILRGMYKGFEIDIHPKIQIEKKKKNIHYDLIGTYYIVKDAEDVEGKERNISDCYNVGQLHFEKNYVLLFPKHWRDPDFEEILDDFVNVLNRENLLPFTEEQYWSMEKKIKEEQLQNND